MGRKSLEEITRGVARMETSHSDSSRLIIGIDFGTTYSGVAYYFTGMRDQKVYAVSNWPGPGGLAPKIPTLINYDKDDSRTFKWGALANKQSDSVVGVKLLLDPNQALPSHVSSASLKRDLKSLPKLPVDVAADFLHAMHKHAISRIRTEFTDLDLFTKEYVMSVPAIWSDVAKNATLEAAKKAGIFPVQLIKEPEAAALYAVRQQGVTIDPGDIFVLCDAGGGTVDLVSYSVEATTPALQLKEVVPGDGAIVGSLALNKRFVAAVQDIVGDDQWAKLRKSKAMQDAESQFNDWIKMEFRGEANEVHWANFHRAGLEDAPESGLEDNSWGMTREDLRAIFDPVVTDILRLIKIQVQSVQLKERDSKVTAIFLVGGFGSSQYLLQRVMMQHPDISVLQPDDAWAAIVKGAVLSRLPGESVVTSVSSLRHYGISVVTCYDSVQDDGQRTWIDEYTGTKRVSRMRWYINIGDDIRRDQKIKFPFERRIPEDYDKDDLIFTDHLYECEDKTAPLHHSKGQKISVNCTLVSNLADVPHSKFSKSLDQHDKPYWKVAYDLVISFESAATEFYLELDGQKFGSVEVDFAK